VYKALFSSNGAISFSIDGVVPGGRYNPSSGAGWSFTNTIPSNSTTTSLPYVNAIMGVLQDTHPTYGSDYYADWSINYEIMGAAPCRMLVVNMYKLAQYSCGTDVGPQTYQIVIYETTNAIDVYVKDRTACTGHNSGSGLIGIQNEDGSQALAPPGRNTGTWSAHEEAWRFIPDGIPNYTFAWYDVNNNLVSSNDQITVGPGTYTAKIVYNSCYGLDIVKEQTVNVVNETGVVLNSVTDLEECEETPGNGRAHFDLTTNNSNALGTNSPADYSIDYYTTETNAKAGTAVGKLFPYNNYQNTSNSQTVWARIQDNSNPNCYDVASFQLIANPSPNVTTSSDVSICTSNSTTLTANGAISYVWSPATGLNTTNGASVTADPTATQTYTVTGTDGNQCVNTSQVTVTVTPKPTPTFTQIPAFCQNSTAPTLPSTSTNGIIGTWNPATVSNSDVGPTTYTFTPNTTECATTQTMVIEVNPELVPAFTQVPSFCENTAAPVLPTTSTNGVTGTWNSVVSNSIVGPSTYTFTPNIGVCATTQTMVITVNPAPEPNFTQIPAFCQNSTAPTLPSTSTDGIGGTWNPATVSNSIVGPTIYTFTPNPGICATGQTMDIIVDPEITPTFTQIPAFCQNSTAPTLPSTSTDGIGGTWNPATVSNSIVGPTTYTFTPNTGICATGQTMEVTVNPEPTFTLSSTHPTECGGTDGTIVINGLQNNTGYDITYDDGAIVGPTALISNGSGTITINGLAAGGYTNFAVSLNGCNGIDNSNITLSDPNPPAVGAGVDREVCAGETTTLTANNPDGAVVTWNNGVTDGAGFVPPVGTTTYTVTANLVGCTNSDQMTITVSPSIAAITCPAALTASCDIAERPAYTSFNEFIAAGGSATIPENGVIDSTSFTLLSEVSDGNSCPETVTRTYQIADTCGVTVTGTQIIIINDLVAPTGTAPGAITVQCIGEVPASDVDLITDAVDNCTVTPIVTHAGDVSDLGTCPEVITRTYNIADACGNNIDVTQLITIQDDTAPTGTAPADITVHCIANLPAADVSLITNAADNCTANPTVTHAGDVSDLGTCPEVITRTYNIADACGNNIDVTQLITIQDDTDPTASNPVPLTVECLSLVPVPNTGVVTDAADNCTAIPTVAFVSESSDANTCNGEVITRVYSVTDDCGNSIDVTHTITVDSYTPVFTVSSTNPTACGENDGTITLSGLTPSTGFTMSYNGGATNPITTNAAGEYVINGLIAGSYIGFTVSDADCPSCYTALSNTIHLVDPNAPSIDAGVDQELCEGSSTSLAATNLDGANISWDNGVTDGAGFIPPVGTINYTVTAELNNCFSSDVVTILIHPTPLVSAGNDLDVCEGDQIALSGSGADTYTWDNGVVNESSFIPPLGITTYTVTGTSIYGCEGTDQLEITVHSPPEVLFTADTTKGCIPLEVNFVSLTPGTTDNCKFTINGTTELLGCNVSREFASAGCYDVTLEVESIYGCKNDSTAYDYICIDPSPIAEFSVYPSELSTFVDNAEFSNASIGAETYEWSFGDGSHSTSTNPNHVYSVGKEESYYIELIAFSELGCTDTVSAELPFVEDLLYYIPNTFTPDGDNHNETFKPIFHSGFDPYDYHLMIYNRWGGIVFESNNASYGWGGIYGIDNTKVVSEGVYIWTIDFKRKQNDETIRVTGHVNLLK